MRHGRCDDNLFYFFPFLPQKIDPGRKRREAPTNGTAALDDDDDDSAAAADSMMLVGRVHVYSPDDLLLAADSFNRTAAHDISLLEDPLQTFATGM